MKRKVRGAILMAMLHVSAHAAEPGAAADPSLDKGQKKVVIAKHDASAGKKNKAVRKKANKPAAAAKPDVKQDSLTETPPEPADQSLQLRGVRG